MTDDELMTRVQQGDITAFETLVRRYEKPVVRYCVARLGGDHHAAEDIAQETFLKLLNGRYQPRSSFRGWLYKIASNLTASYLRKSRKFEAVQFADVETECDNPTSLDQLQTVAASPDEIVSTTERQQAVAAALATLGERHRAVIRLKFIDGLTDPEIAEALGISEGTVRSRIHTALSLLRVRLDDLSDAR